MGSITEYWKTNKFCPVHNQDCVYFYVTGINKTPRMHYLSVDCVTVCQVKSSNNDSVSYVKTWLS